jgi:hypothetical protein
MRKYAELSIEVKQREQVEHVCTLPVTTSATGAIPHTLHVVLKRTVLPDLHYVTLRRSVNLTTCNAVIKLLGD